jgi:Methyltransferase domain
VRTTLYSLVEQIDQAIDLPEPIVEFGARRQADQGSRPAIRERLGSKRCFGADLDGGVGVDQRQNLHSLGLADESIGSALLFDTIEHVQEPWTALGEINRCLKPGGVVVMTSVFFFPVHSCPSDYWRFTASAMEVLLKGYDLSFAGGAGDADFPHTAFGIGAKGPFDCERWRQAESVSQRWLDESATTWKERTLLLAPPWLLSRAYRRFRSGARRYQQLCSWGIG